MASIDELSNVTRVALLAQAGMNPPDAGPVQYREPMEWTTLIAAAVGAAIAIATALLTEHRRDRRETTTEWRRMRLEMYTPLLTGLAQACGELMALAKSPQAMSDSEREAQARQVFGPCYELRHRVEMVASVEVVEAAVEYFRRVRALRNAVIDGCDSDRLEGYDAEIYAARAAAIEAMRTDLVPVKRRRDRIRKQSPSEDFAEELSA